MKTTRIPLPLIAVLMSSALLPDLSQGAVVLDLIGDVSAYTFGVLPGPAPGQIFTDFPTFNCTVLEEFSVAASELVINRVSILFLAQGGYDQFKNVERFSLNFYTAANRAATNLTGDVASQWLTTTTGASVTQVIDPTGSGEFGLVRLDVNITLPAAGTYWVGVSPQSAVAITGQFLVANANPSGTPTPGNSHADLANPGEGFGIGALSALGGDYAYTITAIPEPGSLSLLLLSSAAFLRRRK